MWKHIRRILMVLLACVFLFCGATVAVVQHQYQVNKRLYREAASSFTTQTGAGSGARRDGPHRGGF